MTSLRIRAIKDRDAAAIAELLTQAGHTTLEIPLLLRMKLFMQHHYHHAWVAEEKKIILGFIALSMFELFHTNGKFARIIAFSIDKDHRRSGIGRMLIHHAEAFARERKCDRIEMTMDWHLDENPESFFQHLKFSPSTKYLAKESF